jgi:hypothetical protein
MRHPYSYNPTPDGFFVEERSAQCPRCAALELREPDQWDTTHKVYQYRYNSERLGGAVVDNWSMCLECESGGDWTPSEVAILDASVNGMQWTTCRENPFFRDE